MGQTTGKMERVFTTEVPAEAFHGSYDVTALELGMPAAATSILFSRVRWPEHDSWMSGGPHLETGIPYANIVWEALGLRDRRTRPDCIPEWARAIRSHEEFASGFGILFFTDNPDDAKRYGPPHRLDLNDPAVLDVVEDPHIRSHRGWIAIMRAGSKVPFVHRE